METIIYRDHLSNKYFSHQCLDTHSKKEFKLIETILSLYSSFGVPDFSKYKPIMFNACEIDDDGNFLEGKEYDTPLISMRGTNLEFEDVLTDLESLDYESLVTLESVMKEFSESEKLILKQKFETKMANHRTELLELIPQCKSVRLRRLLLKIHDICVSKKIEIYVDDQTNTKFDVEIEDNFGVDTLSYLEESIDAEDSGLDGWYDSPLDKDFAKLLRGWEWKNVTLKNGKYVIVYTGEEDEEEVYFIGIFSPENICDGQIELREMGFSDFADDLMK